MHGLINRAIERFVVDNYGAQQWSAIMAGADLDFSEFEAMWTYDHDVTWRVLRSAGRVLDRPCEELLEDIGTYLVSHPDVSALRRLLRFGGLDFVDFLHSLDDLQDRARLAVEDLEIPRIEVVEHDAATYSLLCFASDPGWGHVFVGLLRAMADEYGALVFLEHKGVRSNVEAVHVSLLDAEFSEGRAFALGIGSV